MFNLIFIFMNDLTITKAIIRGVVVDKTSFKYDHSLDELQKITPLVRDGAKNKIVKLKVFFKEISYSATVNSTGEQKTGKIIFDDFSKSGVFFISDSDDIKAFGPKAQKIAFYDVIDFTIEGDIYNHYHFTSFNICKSHRKKMRCYDGIAGIGDIIEENN